MPLYLHNGSLLTSGGALAAAQDCCCGGTPYCEEVTCAQCSLNAYGKATVTFYGYDDSDDGGGTTCAKYNATFGLDACTGDVLCPISNVPECVWFWGGTFCDAYDWGTVGKRHAKIVLAIGFNPFIEEWEAVCCIERSSVFHGCGGSYIYENTFDAITLPCPTSGTLTTPSSDCGLALPSCDFSLSS